MTADEQLSAERRAIVFVGSLLGFVIGYALVPYAHLPNLYYDPLARSWFIARETGPLPIAYYGMCLYALAGALVGGALGSVVAWLVRKPLSPRGVVLLCGWGLTLPLIVMTYFGWNNWP
jgi:hypothetical protein